MEINFLSFLMAMKFEAMITLVVFFLLIIKIEGRAGTAFVVQSTNILLLLSFVLGFVGNGSSEIFSGMFRTTPLIAFEKNILLFATLIISLTSYSWAKNHKHVSEFYILMLSSLLGMFFMISSSNLLMFYLGLELSTIPVAALCNFDLEKRISSEAALKMILSSAFSSGILLFGISMIYGTTGSLDFKIISETMVGSTLQLFAFILIFTGFAFKLSVVPFHLWTADVYEGSPVAITAFLSVVSKGSMAFVFITTLYRVFGSMGDMWYKMLALTAVITIITGNLFALRQTNLKRFMAFSSIAQVGYLLIGVSGISALGVTSVVYFIMIYVFSNLAAFGVISVISAFTGKENIQDFKGLYASNPALALVMAIALFSLAGIPPTAGFFGKLFLLTAGAKQSNWTLIIIASLNLIISLYYYLRIVRAMFIEKTDEPIEKINFSINEMIAFVVCVVGILSLGFIKGFFEAIFSLSDKF